MLDERKQLIDVMLRGIIIDEGYARELAQMAMLAEESGHQGFADAARTLGRHHRVKAIELRGRVAALAVGADPASDVQS